MRGATRGVCGVHYPCEVVGAVRLRRNRADIGIHLDSPMFKKAEALGKGSLITMTDRSMFEK